MDDQPTKTRPLAWAGQAVLYAFFAVLIGVFSNWPPYRHLAPDRALVKLSFSHSAQPAGECVKVPPEELAKLPPNMRKAERCPRERSPIVVEIDIDGALALRRVVPPSGLHKDGASSVYQRMEVPAGTHRIAVRMRDDARPQGFNYTREQEVTLQPAQILVVDFDTSTRSITLQ